MTLLLWTALVPVVAGQFLHDPLKVGAAHPFASSTDPTQGSAGWALVTHGVAEKLFTVDRDGNIVPQVGETVTKLSQFSWEVTVKANYYFSDGTAVTNQHVVAAFAELNANNHYAQSSLGTMTMTVVDDGLNNRRFRINSERATPDMMAVLAEFVFVVYLKKNNQFYFTGPFVIDSFVAGDHIDLVPNQHYPRAVERPLVVLKKYATGEDAADALMAGELDMGFHLPVDKLNALRADNDITVKTFLVGYHYMMWYNTRRTTLSDVQVRKALDMALDRHQLTQELRGGDPTRSFFPASTPYALQETVPTADRNAAEALLDAAGWVKNASGFRNKNGEPLHVDLITYPSRPGLVMMQPVVATTLQAMGITVTQIVADGWSPGGEMHRILNEKDFDLMLWAQHTLPSGDPSLFLNNFFRSDGGNNHAGLNLSSIDTLLDNLGHTEGHSHRVSATATIHNAILEQMPVSMLCTPAWHVGLGSRLSDYEPWGSDYYVIRADFGLQAATTQMMTTTATTTITEVDSTNGGARGAGQMMLSGLSVALLWLLASRY